MKSAHLRVFAVALTALLTAGGLASAGDREGSKQVAIVSATPDLVNEDLTLEGVNFGASSGVVTLVGLPVTLISWADNQIVVKLPAEVIAAPGSYLVTVTRLRPRGGRSHDDDDDESKRTGFFIATVGAVGPQGEKGDIGPEGKVGSQGLQGEKGDQGLKGDKGDQGIQGIQGLKGDIGGQGIQGIQGIQGPKGDKGDPGEAGGTCALEARIKLALPVFEASPTCDLDRDGFTGAQRDCDDANPAIHPDAIEVCDGRDNDCDGQVDEQDVCGGGSGRRFAGLVTNSQNPSMPGSGIGSVWSFQGDVGIRAGDNMCRAIGADHACTYGELLQAKDAGELNLIADGTTIWLHRVAETVTFEDPANPGTFFTSPPGAGGRCNDWTFPGNHIADGEYAEFLPDPGVPGAKKLIFHFDKDTIYTGLPGHEGDSASDGGLCAGVVRGIACCFPR